VTEHGTGMFEPDARTVLADRLSLFGWLALPPVAVGYFAMTLRAGTAAAAVQQCLFLLPLYGAVAALFWLVRIAPIGAERRAWSLLLVCTALIAISETYYSWYQVFADRSGPPFGSVFDWMNLVAGLVLLSAIGAAVGFSRLSYTARARGLADVVASAAIVYIGVYHLLAKGVVSDGAAPWYLHARWAAYSSLGLLVLAGVAMGLFALRGARGRRLSLVLASSLAIFALGLILWPLWQAAGPGQAGEEWIDGATGAVVLLGYHLTMMAALIRVASRDEGWHIVLRRPGTADGVWHTTAVSIAVLVAVASCAWWAYHAPAKSPDTWLYVAAATTATIAMVVRTGLASLEIGLLRTRSSSDPATGALNHRCFQEECAELVVSARRRGVPFGLAVLDLDGFARVNSALGHASGDGVLAEVVTSLAQDAGRRAKVYRLSADEFAVIRPNVARNEVFAFGVELLGAVGAIEPMPGVRLSASIGVVSSEAGECSREELLRRARAAQEWAKYHGKARVVAYDERIVHALGTEERLRMHEEQAHRGVARALSAAADARDPRNFYHSRNVAALAVLLGEEAGLQPERVSALEIAAMLHDVGRVALPDAIADGGARSVSDIAKVREHATLSAQLVESLGIDGLPALVRHHHECWDGSGFPDGLSGVEIPLESRIIALANAYDVMTSGRRGGSLFSKSAALQEIDHGMGTRFDPHLAEQFIHVVGTTVALGWSDGWRVPR